MSKGGAAPYRKGAAFERKVQKALQNEGWFVIRSPKSGSEIDLLAVRRIPLGEGRTECWFVQCKMAKHMRVRDRVSLYWLADQYGAEPILAYEKDGKIVYAYINRRGELSVA